MLVEAAQLKAYEERFGSLPFVRSAKLVVGAIARDSRRDALLSFKTPDGRSHLLSVACKQAPVHGSAATELLRQLRDNAVSKQVTGLLVWAPYIDQIAAKVLAEAGIHYLDLQGNCHIALSDRYLAHIERAG